MKRFKIVQTIYKSLGDFTLHPHSGFNNSTAQRHLHLVPNTYCTCETVICHAVHALQIIVVLLFKNDIEYI